MKVKWLHGMGIVHNGQAVFVGFDPAYGKDETVIFCRCGHHPQAFSSSPSLSAMSTHDIMDLLEKWGHKQCEIRDEGTGRISIITQYPLHKIQQDAIEAALPPGITAFFTTKEKNAVPIPKSLQKWARDTAKEIKKL